MRPYDFVLPVFSPTGNENLAEQRSTSQSSGVPGLDSFLAVDGVYDNNGLCWQSLEEDRPWWMVELDQEIAIHRVEINTKADCCGMCVFEKYFNEYEALLCI